MVTAYAGDTLYPALEVDELTPNRTTGVLTMRSTVHNQRGELVMEGMQKYLLMKRPAAAPSCRGGTGGCAGGQRAADRQPRHRP